MQKNIQVFFSNRLNALYQALKQQLFFNSSPLMKRIVVVHGPAMKGWLSMKMAQDPEIGVAAGIEFVHLSQAFKSILPLCTSSQSQFIPSNLELALAIQDALSTIINDFENLSSDEKKIWSPLIDYLNLAEWTQSLKSEKRLINLSQQLARLFSDYGRFSGHRIPDWNKKMDWQMVLWNRLFRADGPWTSLYSLLNLDILVPVPFQLHFFSISFVSKSEFSFLEKLASHIPIFSYLISPCALFWSDIRSDKESAFIHQQWKKKTSVNPLQLEQLEEFLRDRNPLLANFGRLGREMISQIEESSATTSAVYMLPESTLALTDDPYFYEEITYYPTHRVASLLEAVQSDMLLMRNPSIDHPIDLNEEIPSIQLHQAPNKRREVEALYHNLLRLIDKTPDLEPRDIVIVAPHILDYVPHIGSIFGSSESILDYQILDLGLETQSEIVQGFIILLNLTESRWDASSLLHLFEHPCFKRKHRLNNNDLYLIKKWIKEAHILWGDDLHHRNEILRRNHCESDLVDGQNHGTWTYGLDRLLTGLTMRLDSNTESPFAPCQSIEFSETNLLGKWIRLLNALRDDLSPLEDRTLMNICDWVNYFHSLLDHYFLPDYQSSESKEEFDDLKKQLDQFRTASNTIPESQFSFQTIKYHLFELFEAKGITHRENYLQTVRFCSLIPLRSIPAKVIAILGMEEGSFPRPHPISSLNKMRTDPETHYCPQAGDYDRYLFLEAIHTVERFLLISYVGSDPKDGRELNPAIVVEELFSYLNRCYTVNGQLITDWATYIHPQDSFDPSYFFEGSRLPNYSLSDYQACLKHINPKKKNPFQLIDSFSLAKPINREIVNDGDVIDLKMLNELAKDPIKFHLNRRMELYLRKPENRQKKAEEPLSLSGLEKYLIKKETLKKPLVVVLQKTEKEGKLPLGVFKELAKRKIVEEIEEMQLHFDPFDHRETFEIEFCARCSAPIKENHGNWIVPAVRVKIEEDFEVFITGKIPHVSPSGLLAIGKGSLEDIWKIWPQYLLYYHACQNYLTELKPHLLFSGKKLKQPDLIFDSLELIKQYIDYYIAGLNHFSPLLPDWIALILENKGEALQQKMEKLFENDPFRNYSSQDLKWILNKEKLPCAQSAISNWKPQAEKLTHPLVSFGWL